jgi:S-(hydroxymethyl)glutathione dehydrogenase / alcohol dehydrogenase
MARALTVQAQAAMTDGCGAVLLTEVEVDAPGPGEVRVALAAAGLCHTDIDSLGWGQRLVLGHEGAGHVDAVGEDVQGLATGDAVVLNWAMPCGHCAPCRRAEPFLCHASAGSESPPQPFTLRTRWRGEVLARSFGLGTFSTHTVLPRSAVTRVPAGVPMSCACIVGCGVMTGVGSVLNMAHVQPGDSVVVLGCGGVGLNVVQGARIAGAGRIVAIDARESRLADARALGATDVLLAPREDSAFDDLVTGVRALTQGQGADHAFECTGVATLAFRPLLLVRHGGQVLQLSGHEGDQSVPMQWFRWNKRYSAPLYGSCVPERDFARLFRLYLEGTLHLDELATPRYRLSDTQAALEDLRAGRIAKGVIELG